MKIELHCHTKLSDGSHTFEEILELAVQNKISHLAITNHDTTAGLQDMQHLGKQKGIEIIPGIEISAYDFKRSRRVHILGYFIEPGHEAIDLLCSPLLVNRHQASLTMIEKLIQAGYAITQEQVMKFAEGGTGIYKQHIMHALIELGYTASIYGELYKTLFSRGQNGSQPGIAYMPMEYVEASAAIAAIREAGGVPVLAHPGQYGNFEAVPELAACGLQGIEAWHPLHGPDDEVKAQEYALEFDLAVTGGSDFHGFYGETETELGGKSPGIACVHDLLIRKGI